MHDALYSQPYCSANNLGVDILFHLRPHPTADIEVRNVWKAVYLQHVNVATYTYINTEHMIKKRKALTYTKSSQLFSVKKTDCLARVGFEPTTQCIPGRCSTNSIHVPVHGHDTVVDMHHTCTKADSLRIVEPPAESHTSPKRTPGPSSGRWRW